MSEKPTSGAGAWIDPDDAPELTAEHFERADVYDGETLVRRGRPPTGNAKRLVSMRLDQDVLQRLRELGPGWQTRANEALRAFLDRVAKE
jgi:uncharacterized protein (DUF4415 family)